uniref:Uncharacterized protein n=1 Tax=Triticum urartu TaxID=4572 RepID=A0A8R7R495_TRIUA
DYGGRALESGEAVDVGARRIRSGSSTVAGAPWSWRLDLLGRRDVEERGGEMGRREGRVRTARIPAVAPVGGSRPTLDGFPMCCWPLNFFCRVAAHHLSVCYSRKLAPPLRPSSTMLTRTLLCLNQSSRPRADGIFSYDIRDVG